MRILISWIGRTDLKSASKDEPDNDPGPVLRLLRREKFAKELAVAQLDLGKFQYISFHAPSRRVRLSERELVEQLKKVTKFVSAIIVHPDIIESPAEWKPLEDWLVIENRGRGA